MKTTREIENKLGEREQVDVIGIRYNVKIAESEASFYSLISVKVSEFNQLIIRDCDVDKQTFEAMCVHYGLKKVRSWRKGDVYERDDLPVKNILSIPKNRNRFILMGYLPEDMMLSDKKVEEYIELPNGMRVYKK